MAPKQHWFTCLDCEERQMIPRYWLNRRSKPRCHACGGPLIESTTCANTMADGHEARLSQASGIRDEHIKRARKE